jgi:hypothetical protein
VESFNVLLMVAHGLAFVTADTTRAAKRNTVPIRDYFPTVPPPPRYDIRHTIRTADQVGVGPKAVVYTGREATPPVWTKMALSHARSPRRIISKNPPSALPE